MTRANHNRSINAALSSARTLGDQTFARAAGAPLVAGNAIRILKDGKENYPAWLEAIASAKNTIHFETYIIHRDEIGLQFAEALAEGVQPTRLSRADVAPFRMFASAMGGPTIVATTMARRRLRTGRSHCTNASPHAGL